MEIKLNLDSDLFKTKKGKDFIEELLECKEWDKHTRIDVIRYLSKSEDPFILELVASCRFTPTDILSYLVDKTQNYENIITKRDIRAAIATNHNSDAEVLKKLVPHKRCSENCMVVIEVAKNPNVSALTLKELSEHECNEVRIATASSQNATHYVFSRLYNDSNFNVRFAVAKNPLCPIDFLKKLAYDSMFFVREAVAQNPNVTKEILDILSTDDTAPVVAAAKESLKILF